MKKTAGLYVDGFVMAVKKKNLAAYWKMAEEAGKMWRRYGALDYKECLGDDLNTKMGISFPKLARITKDEAVVFSFIVYKSKAQRDIINAKVMKDPSMSEEAWKNKPFPFDMKRMSVGGFKVMVDA